MDEDDEEYVDESGECDCWEYEHVDPLIGVAWCYRCGSRRYLTSEQMRRVEAAQAEYDDLVERENT